MGLNSTSTSSLQSNVPYPSSQLDSPRSLEGFALPRRVPLVDFSPNSGSGSDRSSSQPQILMYMSVHQSDDLTFLESRDCSVLRVSDISTAVIPAKSSNFESSQILFHYN